MRKILIIDHCSDCLFSYGMVIQEDPQLWCCKLDRQVDAIPDDCPLPDAEE